jgi:biopolymer transport protein ExbB
MWRDVLKALQNGNSYMLLMSGIGFFALVLICERVIVLHFVFRIHFTKFLNNLRKMIAAEDFDRAVNLCKSLSTTSLPRITLAALEAMEQDPQSVEGRIEEETIAMIPRIEARTAILPALAHLTLLVGVLGTVDQLWWAFRSVEVLDTARKQASLSTGIAGSLHPTALGLLIGMVILLGHQWVKSMAIKLIEELHYGVTVVHNLFVPKQYALAPTATPKVVAAPVQEPPPQETEIAHETSKPSESLPVEDIKDEEEII